MMSIMVNTAMIRNQEWENIYGNQEKLIMKVNFKTIIGNYIIKISHGLGVMW
jgi:hypothetical protein